MDKLAAARARLNKVQSKGKRQFLPIPPAKAGSNRAVTPVLPVKGKPSGRKVPGLDPSTLMRPATPLRPSAGSRGKARGFDRAMLQKAAQKRVTRGVPRKKMKKALNTLSK